MKEKISILDFIPKKVLCGKNSTPYPLCVKEDNSNYLFFSYIIDGNNNSKREHSLCLPRFINKNNETFEVLGLLQAEMGKTNNGCMVFCNHEYRLVNKVMNWFEKEFELPSREWKWYIKVNINEPINQDYKKEIENKVTNHWLSKTNIKENMKRPKVVSYIKNTKNTKLKFYDYGTLIIEYKSNLFSQIIKRFVKSMSYNMLEFEEDCIRSFIRGILAGEGCVNHHKKSRHYSVHISACASKERNIYQACLSKLGIEIKHYEDYKEMLISKRENLIKLLQQRLMCLSPKKYNKFLFMMQQYPGIKEETGYFSENKTPWNKIPQEKINKIIELHKQDPKLSTNKIAKELGISQIKVQRVLKENNLGKRLVKTPEDKRKQIAIFASQNPSLRQYEIAQQFNVHESVVRRAVHKYPVIIESFLKELIS